MVTRMLRRPRPRTTARPAWRRVLSSRLAPLRRSPEGGQAVVELALALPILLVVVLGIVDFGRAVNYWNDETHVANLAARYAAVGVLPSLQGTSKCPAPAGNLISFAEFEACLDSVRGPVTVCVSIPKAEVGQPVTVKLSSQYSWLPLPKVVGVKSTKFTTATLSGTATMRLERVPPSNFATTAGPC
jgi:hypothetical protein